MILKRKKCISRGLMQVCFGLIILAACTSSRFPCLLLVSRVWDISSGISPFFSLAGGLCKFYANAGGIQASQSTFSIIIALEP
jgi:hypothetical protein